MSFKACIQPFGQHIKNAGSSSFYAIIQNQRELEEAIKKEMKLIRSSEYIGEEWGNGLAEFEIEKNNFLSDIQEFGASIDKGNIELIYKGTEQTRFNHLIEIRNNIGVYLPVFFFFPMRISLKQSVLPIFVGSAPKLYMELQELKKELKSIQDIEIEDLEDFFEASEEDLEDYEAVHEGVEQFWPSFSYIILQRLAKITIKSRMPLFIY